MFCDNECFVLLILTSILLFQHCVGKATLMFFLLASLNLIQFSYDLINQCSRNDNGCKIHPPEFLKVQVLVHNALYRYEKHNEFIFPAHSLSTSSDHRLKGLLVEDNLSKMVDKKL